MDTVDEHVEETIPEQKHEYPLLTTAFCVAAAFLSVLLFGWGGVIIILLLSLLVFLRREGGIVLFGILFSMAFFLLLGLILTFWMSLLVLFGFWLVLGLFIGGLFAFMHIFHPDDTHRDTEEINE